MVQAEKGELVAENEEEQPGSQEKSQEREAEARKVFQAGTGVGGGWTRLGSQRILHMARTRWPSLHLDGETCSEVAPAVCCVPMNEPDRAFLPHTFCKPHSPVSFCPKTDIPKCSLVFEFQIRHSLAR